MRICGELELLTGSRIIPGATLLFLDEIQACPRALKALAYFHEEMPDLHVAAAGSLLEFALGEISVPVGRLQFPEMHPMGFAEFLDACGHASLAEKVLQSPSRLPDAVHGALLDHLRRYLFVGGMPECVATYARTGSARQAFDVQGEICNTYRMDFAKYAPRADKHCLEEVLVSTARTVGGQIKYSRLADGYAHSTIRRAFETLAMSRVLRRVASVNPPREPLDASASRRIFKPLMADVGVMQHLCGISTDIEYAKPDLLDVYRGALAEQFVGQELVLSQPKGPYYWSRHAKSSTAEVDFICVREGTVHPVEVKSGSAGRLRSLHMFLRSFPWSGGGLILSQRSFDELPEQKIRFIPLYSAFSATGGIGTLA